MDKKQFERNAQILLKHGIGDNIEGARRKLQALIEANKITNEHRGLSIVGMLEFVKETNEEENKRRWKSKVERDYEAFKEVAK